MRGQEFKLPDGSVLKLRLTQSLLGSELRILRNGQPIPGSASHPETTVKTAYWTLFLIGALGILFGGLSLGLHVDMLGEMGITDYSIGLGVVFIILGLMVRRHSLPALYAGIALYAVDTVLGLVLTAQSGGTPGIFNILFRGLIFMPLVQGVGAMRALKASRADRWVTNVEGCKTTVIVRSASKLPAASQKIPYPHQRQEAR